MPLLSCACPRVAGSRSSGPSCLSSALQLRRRSWCRRGRRRRLPVFGPTRRASQHRRLSAGLVGDDRQPPPVPLPDQRIVGLRFRSGRATIHAKLPSRHPGINGFARAALKAKGRRVFPSGPASANRWLQILGTRFFQRAGPVHQSERSSSVSPKGCIRARSFSPCTATSTQAASCSRLTVTVRASTSTYQSQDTPLRA